MITINNNKLVIEIPSTAALEDIFNYKKSLLIILQCLDKDSCPDDVLENIEYVTKLIQHMDFTYDQCYQIERVVKGFTPDLEDLQEQFRIPA